MSKSIMFTERQKEIIELLIKNPDGIIGAKFAEALDVSTRTIRNEISSLNETLKYKRFSVRSSNKIGYFVDKRYVDRLKELLQSSNGLEANLLPENRLYAILGLILFKGEQNCYDLADLLFVSEQTIFRDFNKLNKTLMNKYKFTTLTMSNNSINLDSPENEIRFLLFRIFKELVLTNKPDYLKNLQRLLNGKFNFDEYRLLTIKIKNFFTLNKLILDDKSLELVAGAIYIVVIRNRNGFKLKKRENVLINDTFDSLITDLMQSGVELGNSDKDCLHQFLWSIKISHVNKDFESNISGGTICILNDFCREVLDKYSIDLRESEETINNLKIHMEYMIRRIVTNFELTNPIISEIKKRYPFSYEVAMLIVHIIYKYKKKYISDDEISYIAIYIEDFLHKSNLKLKTVVVSDSNTGINNMLINWINSNFINQIEVIEYLPLYSLESYLENHKVDLIISTNIINSNLSIPSYIVKRIPERTDYMSLYNLIHNLKMKNRYKKSIMRVFDIDFLKIYDVPVSLNKIIRDMSKDLKQHQYIMDLDEFYEDVLLREENYPTLIGKNILAPHPLTNFSQKTTVCVSLLKKPLIYKGEKIRLIFLLAIENMTDDDVSAIYHFIKQLALDQGVLDQLFQINNKDELLRELIHLSNLFVENENFSY